MTASETITISKTKLDEIKYLIKDITQRFERISQIAKSSSRGSNGDGF